MTRLFLAPLLAASLLCLGAASAPRAIVFKKAASTPQAARQICALPGVQCGDPAQVELYQAEGAWWAILPSRPALLSLDRTGGAWTLKQRWDFADRERSFTDSGARTIHPALYPAAPGVWAAALIETRSQGYSGGGGTFSQAEFIPLDGKTASPFPEPVPFSCANMVRACFSEQDYKTSKHCHDEWEGWLTLRYAAGAGAGPYVWTGTWHEKVWPQAVAEGAAKTTRSALADANFCAFPDR